MIFEQIPIGRINNVAYIVGDEKSGEVALVDVGFKHKMILDRVKELGAQVKYILATHHHDDHWGCATKIKRETGAPFAAFRTFATFKPSATSKRSKPFPSVDIPLDDGDELQVGDVHIEVLHTPGHTPDHICFLINREKLLTGDTLYVGKAPKCTEPNTRSQMRLHYDSLHNRVMKQDDDIEVWPGHDVGKRPSSTIGKERKTNSVLKMNFEGFRDRRYDRDADEWVVPSG